MKGLNSIAYCILLASISSHAFAGNKVDICENPPSKLASLICSDLDLVTSGRSSSAYNAFFVDKYGKLAVESDKNWFSKYEKGLFDTLEAISLLTNESKYDVGYEIHRIAGPDYTYINVSPEHEFSLDKIEKQAQLELDAISTDLMMARSNADSILSEFEKGNGIIDLNSLSSRIQKFSPSGAEETLDPSAGDNMISQAGMSTPSGYYWETFPNDNGTTTFVGTYSNVEDGSGTTIVQTNVVVNESKQTVSSVVVTTTIVNGEPVSTKTKVCAGDQCVTKTERPAPDDAGSYGNNPDAHNINLEEEVDNCDERNEGCYDGEATTGDEDPGLHPAGDPCDGRNENDCWRPAPEEQEFDRNAGDIAGGPCDGRNGEDCANIENNVDHELIERATDME